MGVMPCLLPPCIAALVACNPPPKEATMRNPSSVPGTAARESRATETEGQGSAAPGPTGQGAQGPQLEPVSAAGSSASAPRADSPAEAQGRRALSTAFVRVGPDGHLTVELRNGRFMVLRDVVMRPRDYCGVQGLGGSARTRLCGGEWGSTGTRPRG